MENTQNKNENTPPPEIDLAKCSPAMKAYLEAKAELIQKYGKKDSLEKSE